MNINKIIYKFLNNSPSKEELDILEEWKNESLENLKEFQAIQSKWAEFSDMKAYREYNKEKAWKSVESKMDELIPVQKATESSKIISLVMKVAAGLALIAAVGFILLQDSSTQSTDTRILAAEEEIQEHQLVDESNIWLNKGTQLDVTDFDVKNRRLILLEGEAYFEVTSDKTHPFVIDMGKYSVEVVGTEFNINRQGTDVYLHVTEGAVKFSNGQRTINVSAGEMVQADAVSMSKTKSKGVNETSWKTKKLIFNNTILSEAVRDLSEYYGIEIVLTDDVSKKGNCLLNTSFSDETLDEMLEEMESVYGVEYQQKENKIVFTKTDC